uniref:Uncharacterized protein n=1 Tax=Pseudomonas aeruginosa TaxID=287 RepID=A0A2L1KGJ0_PSEAI|nr:Hypothetical protein [Pseudomonas aeruginosa]UVN18799.1 Hypothetical protein [Pseudomonas aeruginosa]
MSTLSKRFPYENSSFARIGKIERKLGPLSVVMVSPPQ